MRLEDIVKKLDLTVRAGSQGLDNEVLGGYVSDMLSDVIANSQKGDIWMTLQIHQNIIAVAMLKEMAGIIIIGGKEPQKAAIDKADAEKMPLLVTPHSAFETAGRLYELGVRGQV
jgi:predicted transcriptional regulator